MQQAQPAPGERAVLLAIRRIAPLAGILEEQPAKLVVVLRAAIVVERGDGQVRQDVLIDGTFYCCCPRHTPFGNDRGASRPHAPEPVDRRLLYLSHGVNARGRAPPWLELLPGPGRRVVHHRRTSELAPRLPGTGIPVRGVLPPIAQRSAEPLPALDEFA